MRLISHIVRACRELTTKIIIVSKNNLVWVSFPVIFAAAIFLFYPSLTYYFFQDDWFVLNWVRTDSFWDLLKFRTDIIYWRPISMPLFFKLSSTLFDLAPLGFHLIGFLFHLANSTLVYILFKKLQISRQNAILASFIYATAAFHFVPLSWSSTTSYLIGPTFILSSIILFLKNRIISSLSFFVLGLTTSELALTVVPIILTLKGFNVFKKISPYIIISLIYAVVRFFIIPVARTGVYEVALNPQVITNLFWYFAWIFNMPEKMPTVFYFANIPQSIQNSLEFWRYFTLPLILIGNFFLLIFISRVNIQKITRGMLIFLLGLSPIILLPKHVYPMYLVIASLGIIYILIACLDQLKSRRPLLSAVTGFLFFASSLLTISFTRQNHWLVNEQAISRAYINYTKKRIPDPLPNSTFLFKPADHSFSKEHNFILVETEDNVRQSLNDQDAIKVIYNDSTLRSIYLTHQEPSLITEHMNVFEISPRSK